MIRSLDFPGIYLPADSIQFASEAFCSLAHHTVQPQPITLKGFLLGARRAPPFSRKRRSSSTSSAGTEDIKLATTTTGCISATPGTLALLGNAPNTGTIYAALDLVSAAMKILGTSKLEVGATGTL
jgi:hypothetical protein